jgi:pimeloyl-ACP methyl ester carboxylesterase
MSLGLKWPCKPHLLVLSTSLLGLTALVLGFSLCLSATSARAADDTTEKKAEKKADEEEIKPPEDAPLTTDDGLELKTTYFPGSKGPESIPVILLHGFKGNRKDFTQEQGLAPYLQEKLGCAVIVPDLRGHGESLKITKNKQLVKPTGRELLPALMITQDLRAVKDFLWKKNNEKLLNIDKLVVIGAEEGAALALSYAAYDAVGYEQGEAKYGPLKLGKFVKAVALISPVTNVVGLKPTTAQVMRIPEVCRDLSVMIAVGNKNKERFKEAEQLGSQFVKARPAAANDTITVYFFKKLDTPLQGVKLMAEPSLKVPEKIVAFLTVRLIKNPDAKDWVWKERKLPHE